MVYCRTTRGQQNRMFRELCLNDVIEAGNLPTTDNHAELPVGPEGFSDYVPMPELPGYKTYMFMLEPRKAPSRQ